MNSKIVSTQSLKRPGKKLMKPTLMLLFALLTAGCTSYGRGQIYFPKIDGKAGLYVTEATVNKEDLGVRDTNVDLRKFRFVYLQTGTDVYPERFEFFVRNTLARIGFLQVLNPNEFSALLSSDEKVCSMPRVSDREQGQISRIVGPILRVQIYSYRIGVYRRGKLSVMDLSKEVPLLEVYF
jgi:hypothetical protein